MPALDTTRAHPEKLPAAFESVYRGHFDFVWRSLRRFGVAEAALDDATQEVFVVVYRRFGAWEGEGKGSSVRAWLYGVARKVAANIQRGEGRRARKLAALPAPPGPRALDERAVDRERLERIAAALDGLSPPRRQVVVLAKLEGLSAPEIAAALGCNLNTVYSRLRRAQADLQRALGEVLDGEREGS